MFLVMHPIEQGYDYSGITRADSISIQYLFYVAHVVEVSFLLIVCHSRISFVVVHSAFTIHSAPTLSFLSIVSQTWSQKKSNVHSIKEN